MNYKIKVDGNIEELTSLFIALGCKYFNHTVTEKNYMIVENGNGFFCKLKSNFKKSECKEISIDQLKDMVVLQRNDISDATHENTIKQKLLKASSGWYIFNTLLDVWEWYGGSLKGHEFALWQRETLNDKVASAEVARQEFIGAPFSDLPEVNSEAVDDFVESNVEQGVKHPHYKKDISHLDTLDIYRVTELFNPHACGAHIAKKALCSGQRGHKDLLTDIQDIIDTAERWKEMLIEDEKAK